MADAPISGLPETTIVGDNDLILLEQSGDPKKVKGSNWKQYFNANVIGVATNTIQPNVAPSATYNQSTHIITLNLPSADYISSVAKTSTSGLVDTYTITTKLGYTATFTVTNAKSISSVTLQSGDHSAGTLDTYRINFNNNTHTDFQVYNGANGIGSPSSATPKTDSGTGVAGSSTDFSRSDHQHPMNVPTSGTPEMDGTASRSKNNSTYYAAFDHVHPTDTSRASQDAMTTAQGNITGLQACLPSTVLSDANSITGVRQQLVKIDGNTLHTPYKEGLTLAQTGMLVSYSNTAGTEYVAQLAIMTGDRNVYHRAKNNGTWYSWTPIFPRGFSLTLPLSGWTQVGSSDVYSQSVTLSLANITSATRIDLFPDSATIMQMVNDGVYGIYVENNLGTLTAYAVGASPTLDLTISGTAQEVM